MRGGRPAAIELDHALEYRICSLVREGVALIDCAHACGIGPRTLYRWLHWGRRADHGEIYTSFADSVAAAEAERRHYVRQVIAEAQHAGRAVN